jgi:Tfp pilus assembly protein PilF
LNATMRPLSLLLVMAACGGSSTSPPPKEPTPTTTAEERKPEPAAAQSSSDDVKKGIAALKGGDTNGAKAAFEVAIQKNPKQADAYHYLAVVQEQLGQKADAEKNYRKALELDGALEESATNLAALLVDSGKYDEAAALMKKAIAKNPKSAGLHVNLGMALAGKNDADGASKEFEEAIRLDSHSGIYLVTYAGHLARTGKKDDAIAKLKQAEKISASDAGVLASVALAYKDLKDFKSCIAVLDKAVALKDVAELRIYRGTCKLGQRDLSGATTEFRDAVTKEPNNAVAHYSLGNALADSGKLADAITEWETTMKLAPDTPQAKGAEKKIRVAKEKMKK